MLRVNGLEEGYIRPIVFVGEGAMGVYAPNNPVRTAVTAWKWGAYLGDDALKNGHPRQDQLVRAPPHQREPREGQDHRPVHEQRPRQARGEARRLRRGDPARHERYVSEGSGENIFIVKHGAILTPDFASSILEASPATRSSRSRKEDKIDGGRVPHHARQALARGRSVLHRHGRGGHAGPRGRQPPHRRGQGGPDDEGSRSASSTSSAAATTRTPSGSPRCDARPLRAHSPPRCSSASRPRRSGVSGAPTSVQAPTGTGGTSDANAAGSFPDDIRAPPLPLGALQALGSPFLTGPGNRRSQAPRAGRDPRADALAPHGARGRSSRSWSIASAARPARGRWVSCRRGSFTRSRTRSPSVPKPTTHASGSRWRREARRGRPSWGTSSRSGRSFASASSSTTRARSGPTETGASVSAPCRGTPADPWRNHVGAVRRAPSGEDRAPLSKRLSS